MFLPEFHLSPLSLTSLRYKVISFQNQEVLELSLAFSIKMAAVLPFPPIPLFVYNR